MYERRADALGTARFLIGGYRNVSIDPSMRQSTRGGAPSSLMAKAIYGHIGKAFSTDPPLGATPPARPPIASQPVVRLNATLVFDPDRQQHVLATHGHSHHRSEDRTTAAADA